MSEQLPERYVTDRGCTVYDEFRDASGNLVRVLESSDAEQACVRIGVAGSAGVSPELTLEQAVRAIAALDAWVRDHE